jgi:endo-1,3-1,4-beta-glycanase ExoK
VTALTAAAPISGWSIGVHPLGRGYLRAENVSLGETLVLSLSVDAHDGAEIASAARHGHGVFEARMRTPHAPGSLSAFFLYEGVEGGNDEIDIEIHNDGSRRILFTTWAAGVQTNAVTATLAFDPADGFHDYRIEWRPRLARFSVDGQVLQEFRHGIPPNDMFVMANAWWPAWLSGPLLASARLLEIEHVHAGG